MKNNYLFFHRPACLMLAVLWLAMLPNPALGQQISVSKTSLADTVDYKSESTQPFYIRNTGNTTLTWSAQVNGAGPTAQQNFTAGPVLLREDFEAWPFSGGWTTKSIYEPEGRGWVRNDRYVDIVNLPGGDNVTGGTGFCALTIRYEIIPNDNELISPLININGYRDIHLQYKASFWQVEGPDELNLDIQLNDNGPWKTVLSWDTDHGGGQFSLPGETVNVSLRDHIPAGTNSFRIRWHYTDHNRFYSYSPSYAEIDEVIITAESLSWLNVLPSSGSIEPGDSVAVIANFDAADRAPGTYTANLVITSNDLVQGSISIPAALEILAPSKIQVPTETLTATVEAGQPASFIVTVANTGQSVLTYKFDTPRPSPPFATPLYQTSFENPDPTTDEFYNQDGWNTQWFLVNDFPATGLYNILGAGGTAYSPITPSGPDRISAAVFKTLIGELDATLGIYRITPRSASGNPVTVIEFSRYGLMEVLAWDTAQAVYREYTVSIPTDTVHAEFGQLGWEHYIEIWIKADRITGAFSVYTDGILRFSGKGQPVDIQQVVFDGPGFWVDVDDFAIYNGDKPYFETIINPISGSVPASGSEATTVTFQSPNMSPGIYRDTLVLASNDPAQPEISIPVAITVLGNEDPVLSAIDTVKVREFSEETVTFTATDPDNDTVIVVLQNIPAFITPLSSANGSAEYRIKPQSSDVGEYDLTVLATDNHGGATSANFHLSVVVYGVETFYLYNVQTHTRLETFTDSVTLDINRPDYHALAIQAETNPVTVGSLKFWWDNHATNVDNTAPYRLNPLVLLLPQGGRHTLKTQAFFKANAKGKKGTPREVIVNIVNSSTITSIDVVKPNGEVIIRLGERVIDVSLPEFQNINLRANTNGPLKSVVFKLDGSFHRVDNNTPYMFHGNFFGKDIPWQPTPGTYTLEVTPYSLWYGLGIAGATYTQLFQVIYENYPARKASVDDIVPEETRHARFSLYPVPVSDVLHVTLPAEEEGAVRMLVHDAQGRSLYATDHNTKASREHNISTAGLGMNSGVYYLQVQYISGKREIRKFIKE